MENINENPTPEDVPPIAPEIELEEEQVKNATSNIPVKENDLFDVSKVVSKNWIADPISLKWNDPASLAAEVEKYKVSLKKRTETGTGRSPVTQQLENLDDKIDNSLSYVKGYIADEYDKKNAVSYYGQFGIEKEMDTYILPRDRNDRKSALGTLISGLVKNGFDIHKYGVAFWTPIKEEYETLYDKAESIDGEMAKKVSNKNQLKESITKTLRAIVHLLKANYPETFEAELRKWGFQKEKY